jgi:hypothetical protein
MWLGEEDIEPDPGEPAVIKQPTKIVTRPLDPASPATTWAGGVMRVPVGMNRPLPDLS